MEYDKVRVFKPSGKKRQIGLYNKAKSICLIVLGLLIFISLFSVIFKEKVFIIEEKKYYGVYVGAYATQATADYYATVAKSRGGCGGVYKNKEQYLVFVAVYISKEDASTIADKLSENEEANVSVYTFEIPKVKIKLNDGNKGILNQAFSLFGDHTKQLMQMAIDFDNNTINGSDIIVDVTQMISEIDNAIKVLSDIQKEEDDAVAFLIDAFSRQKTSLKQISSNVIKSADIKITYFDLLMINISVHSHFE